MFIGVIYPSIPQGSSLSISIRYSLVLKKAKSVSALKGPGVRIEALVEVHERGAYVQEFLKNA